MRQPYGASFRATPAFIDGSPVGLRIEPSSATGTIQTFVSPDTVFGGRPLTSVAFPSQKVMCHDLFARH